MKRIISLVLTLALVLGMVPAIGLSAGAESYTAMDKVAATIDTGAAVSAYGATEKAWVPMFPTGTPDDPTQPTWVSWSESNYAEIVAEGHNDIGALHMVSASGKNSGVAFNAGMTAGESYTLGLWAKGTSNSGQVLISYGNGDFIIIAAAETLGADWTYYEASFTASVSQINLNARDWGNSDIYIDNITICDASGNDLLAGYGDFYTYGEATKDSDVTGELKADELFASDSSASAYNAPAGVWTPMFPSGSPEEGSWSAWDDVHYVELVSDGYLDAGALHFVSAAGANAAIAIGGLTTGATYTLSLWAKGTAQSQNLFSYGNGDCGIAEAADISSEWKQFTYTFTATMNQFNLGCRDWGTNDIYVDNITITDENGNELLGCAGTLCHKKVTQPAKAATCTSAGLTEGASCSACGKVYTAQTEIAAIGHSYGATGTDGHAYCANCGEAKLWTDMDALDASASCASYGGAVAGQWVVMYESGEPSGTYPEWSSDRPYGEIVEDGHNDPGSLHLASDGSKNAAVAIKADMVSGEQYTLGLWAKGTSNSGSVLISYGNGDVEIIAGSANLGADWTYYEAVITANRNLLNLVARDWGTTDIYIDNITLTDAAGNDLLAGCGDFCTDIDPDTVAVVGGLDATGLDDLYDAPADRWVPFSPWANYQDSYPAWESGVNYGEVVSEGHDDPGALHLVSAANKNAAVVIDPGMTVGESYTIGMWVKGSATNTNKILALYGNGDGSIIGAAEYSSDGAVGATAISSDWSYVEKTFTASVSCLAIVAADWGTTDIYIDNITLTDAAGNDLLAGNGDFCTYEVPVQADIFTIDTSAAYPWYGGAPSDKWSVVYETGVAGGTWAEWSSDRPYGEIVEEGYLDAGALHLASDSGKNAAVGIGVAMVTGEQYTLGLWAKGTSNSGNVLISFGNGDASIIGASEELTEQWTYYETVFTANVQQLNLLARDWGTTDVYIDNVTLKNADGVDLIAGYGDFCTVVNTETPNVPVDDVVSGTADAIDTTKHAWDNLAHMDAWTPFFPAGPSTDTGWSAWTDASNASIAAIGKSDAGSLHIIGDGSAHVGVAIEAGLIPGSTYVLKAYIKGYAQSVTGGVQMYGNGDGYIAKLGYHQSVENNADWTEVQCTFVATRTALQLYVPASTGIADIYIDDIQVLDAEGVNVLGSKGCFSVLEENIPDLAVISSDAERSYRWYWNTSIGSMPSATVDSGIEVISEGCEDPGALYLWQNTCVNDTMLALVTTQAKDLTDGATYTLSMNVKGIFSYAELLSVWPAYISQDNAKTDMNIPNKLKEVLGITSGDGDVLVVPEWTTLTWELPYNDGENGFTYLNLYMSKYTWATHCYIDNIQVLDPDGNDVLGGAGSFMDSGSESYPIRLVKTDVEIQNSGTMYYMAPCDAATVNVCNHEEKVLLTTYTFGDQNFAVTHNGTTAAASSKNVTMDMASTVDGMPIIFSVTSTEGIMEEDQSRVDEINIYDVSFTNCDSSVKTLPMGQQELSLAWGDADGYSYTYTAASSGILTVTAESGDVSVLLTTADETVSGSIELLAGETVTVQVIADQNAYGGYIASDAVISSSFTATGPAITSASLTLNGILTLNVKTVYADGCTLRATIGENVQTVAGTDGVYAIAIPAHRLHEAVALELLDGETVVASATWTVADYAAGLRAAYGDDDAMMALLDALLNYGSYAAAYTAGESISIEAVEAVAASDLDGCKHSVSVKNGTGLKPVTSLYLDDACDLLIKFSAEAFDGCTLYIDGTAVEMTESGDQVVYTIEQLLPQDWSHLYDIKVTSGEEVIFQCSYSVLSYAAIVLAKDTEPAPGLNGLLKAMYLYSAKAEAYIN